MHKSAHIGSDSMCNMYCALSFFCKLLLSPVTAIWRRNKNVPTPEICKRVTLPVKLLLLDSTRQARCVKFHSGVVVAAHARLESASTQHVESYCVPCAPPEFQERQFVIVTHRKFCCKTKNAAIHKWILNCRWRALQCKIILRSLESDW